MLHILTVKKYTHYKKSNAQVKYLLCVASQNSVNENRKITKQVTYQNFVTITDATHKDTYISLLSRKLYFILLINVTIRPYYYRYP